MRHLTNALVIVILIMFISMTRLTAADSECVVLVGDSTVATRSGWGDEFGSMLSDGTKFVNLAQSGRSSKSYRDEGWWKKVLAEEPTWVFIQFGHNDQPGKGAKRETAPNSSFRDNLIQYVNEARQVGAKPILVTSLTRRIFDSTGQINPEKLEPIAIPEGFRLTDYAAATRAVAKQLDVPVIDLNSLSIQQMNLVGPEAAMKFSPKPKDRTHLNEYGAKLTAKLVADELRKVVPEFAPLLSPSTSWRFDFGGSSQDVKISLRTINILEEEDGRAPGLNKFQVLR